MKHKFKVGDVVKIVDCNSIIPNIVTRHVVGDTIVISDVGYEDDENVYRAEDDYREGTCKWYWFEGELELVEDEVSFEGMENLL